MAKSLNKWIIWLVIGSTVAWVAKMASTEKGKEKIQTRKDKALDTTQWFLNFIQWWIEELKKQSWSQKKK
jgi:hypothetical protein